jgi:hypothetical protein
MYALCRNGKDVGRSVSAWGYWGDILNGPYHCFGTVCEDASYFSVTNKQYGRTAVDIAEHNVMVRDRHNFYEGHGVSIRCGVCPMQGCIAWACMYGIWDTR